MSVCDNVHPRILDRMCVAFSQTAKSEGSGAALVRAKNLWGTDTMKYLNNKDIEHKKELAANER
mgnify:CR=1 FL=1